MRASLVGVVIGALVGAALVPPSQAQPAPDFARAKDLYATAEAAAQEGRFADAARDYGAAYEITRDPVLFWKIGSAHERAGKCDVALIYYGRYLREAHPSEAFVTLTRERIVACGGDPQASEPGATGSAAGSGSASGSGSGSGSGSASGSASGAGSGAASGSGSGSAAAPSPVRPHDRAAWLLVTGSIALVTVGAVLAYSANSAENDVADLYVGLGGQPPAFDDKTRTRYDELIATGRRYEHLSWASFGLAGATAIGAAVLFLHGRHAEDGVILAPTVSPTSGGVSALLRF